MMRAVHEAFVLTEVAVVHRRDEPPSTQSINTPARSADLRITERVQTSQGPGAWRHCLKGLSASAMKPSRLAAMWIVIRGFPFSIVMPHRQVCLRSN